jgi:hypothetical protein
MKIYMKIYIIIIMDDYYYHYSKILTQRNYNKRVKINEFPVKVCLPGFSFLLGNPAYGILILKMPVNLPGT